MKEMYLVILTVFFATVAFAADHPPLAKAPFNAVEAEEYQQQWAKHLGKQVFETNSLGMKMVLIPPGEFWMGSSRAEVDEAFRQAKEILKDRYWLVLWSGWLQSEAPRHRVKITKPFYLSATEVTVGQFRQFVEATGHETAIERAPTPKSRRGRFPQLWIRGKHYDPPDDDCPVSSVSWTDALAFCKWLTEKESMRDGETPAKLPIDAQKTQREVRPAVHEYRPPMEAEWEYACRAGTTTKFFFGDDPEKLPQFVQFGGNGSPQRLYRVGRKKPNQFGLYDTLGGVYEWCSDWYAEDYYECSPLDDPLGPAAPKAVYWPHQLPLLDPGLDREREVRVLRGGAFNFESPLLLRCAHRIGLGTTGGHWHLGFRTTMSVRSDRTDAVRQSNIPGGPRDSATSRQ